MRKVEKDKKKLLLPNCWYIGVVVRDPSHMEWIGSNDDFSYHRHRKLSYWGDTDRHGVSKAHGKRDIYGSVDYGNYSSTLDYHYTLYNY